LNGRKNVGQVRLNAPIRSHARENPGASFVIHQPSGSIDRIKKYPESGRIGITALWEYLSHIIEPFTDEENHTQHPESSYERQDSKPLENTCSTLS
tara:strand:+ start:179 stop:466 length:288 start_codon:yes stop_codon:yes gene_type:complete